MLNGDGNENYQKINSLISNKNTTLHTQYTFLYIPLPFFSEKNVLLLVFLFAIFSLPLIFNLLAAAC